MKTSRYLLRLLLFSLVLGLVPVLLLGFYSYYKSSEAVRQNIEQSDLHMLVQSQAAVEQTLMQVDSAVMQVISQPSVQSWLNRRLTENDFVDYRNISAALSNLPLARSVISNMALVSVEQDWMIGTNGLTGFSDSPEHDRLMSYALLPKSSNWVTTSELTASGGEETSGGEAKVTLVKKLPLLTNTSAPKGLFVMDIYLKDITQMLSMDNQLGDLVILDANLVPLNDPMQVLGRPGGSMKSFLELLRQAPVQWSAVMEWAEPVHVTSLRSSYNGWTYVSVVPIKQMNRDIRSIGWLTLWVSAVIFTVTVVLGWMGTRRMYSPIRRLYEVARTSQQPDSGDSARDELSFIEGRIETLLEDGRHMRDQLKVYQPQLKELFVMKLLRDQVREGELDARIRALHFPESWSRFCVLTLQIDDTGDYPYNEDDRDLLLFAINNIVTDLVRSAAWLPPVVDHDTQITVLAVEAFGMEAVKAEINQAVKNISSAVKQYLRLRVSIGVSRPYAWLSGTHMALAEAMEALRFRLKLGTGVVLHYDEVLSPSASRQSAPYPKEKERELLEAIRMQDGSWAHACLKAFIRHVLAAGMTTQEFQLMMSRLLLSLLELVQHDDTVPEPILGSKSIFGELARVASRQEAEALFWKDVVQPVIRYLEERRKTAYDSITESVIRFIEHNYDTNLTLEYCASQLNFHPTYVGRVFRKETGFSFSEYLAQYRLNVSKKWLTDSDMKIQDIAAKLKYNSPAAFIRYFRNMEGVTPGQYRDKAAALKDGMIYE